MRRPTLSLVILALVFTTTRPAFADTLYVVQPGDTLYRIALRFGVSQQAIIAANGIANPNRIFAGQRLVIPTGGGTPGPTQPPPPSGGGRVYIVQRGDTLFLIARRFGVSVQSLVAANGLADPNRIFAGQRLTIPGVNPTPGPTPGPLPTPIPSGSFELGGHVDTFAFPDKMKFSGMTWAKQQVRWSPGLSTAAAKAFIDNAHAQGFKVLLSVKGRADDIRDGANYDSYADFLGELAGLGADGLEVWNERISTASGRAGRSARRPTRNCCAGLTSRSKPAMPTPW